jgi:hypothetical protein
MTVQRRGSEPPSARSLQARINHEAGGSSGIARRLQLLVADTAIGQMLPPGVLKGGAALQLRYGEGGARATGDLDATRPGEIRLDAWLDTFEERLAAGWAGFTGTLSPRDSKAPDDVPDDYTMRRFQISLRYKGSEWTPVTFELTRDEVGGAAEPDVRIGQRAMDLCAILGLPEPGPIPLLSASHQIVQKLHACTSVNATGENDRAHDLVDIQVLVREEQPDMADMRAIATRLFSSRRRQPWPPVVRANSKWASIYAAESVGLDVLASVDAAVTWANDLIRAIDAATG